MYLKDPNLSSLSSLMHEYASSLPALVDFGSRHDGPQLTWWIFTTVTLTRSCTFVAMIIAFAIGKTGLATVAKVSMIAEQLLNRNDISHGKTTKVVAT